jgi:hypothetical protein
MDNAGVVLKRTSAITPILCFILSMSSIGVFMAIPSLSSWWSMDYFKTHVYLLGTLGQILMDLPPIIFFLFLSKKLRADNLLCTKPREHLKGILIGLLGALVLAGIRLLVVGHFMNYSFMGGVDAFMQSMALASPWNILSSVMAILAYGPGEAMFVVYLILAFDNALGNKRLISWGVLITSFLWALPHLMNIAIYGSSAIINTGIMFFMGIITAIIFKKTRSILAPMIFWTLVNGTSF